MPAGPDVLGRYGGVVVVRCTARLLKLLAPIEVAEVPPATHDWYANLVWIDRRKCLLLVHADTLFPVFVVDVRKSDLAKLGDYVTATIATALTSAGFAADHLGPLHPDDVQVARTASRSVLGFMNDMAATAEYITTRDGGITRLDVLELNAFLLRTPYNRDGYVRPIDAVRAI
jgi:hypothetical protein